MTAIRYALALAAALAIGPGSAAAQGYPNKPITIIVPAGAGGPTDTVARSIIGTVTLLASANVDAGNSQLMVTSNIGLVMKAASGTSSVWLGAVVRSGTPTYGATGIRLKLGVLFD
jgi:tripartite-type tricarboxylate transporter receptor subunit TctC